MKILDKYPLLFLLLVCLLIFFTHLDALPVNIMEARNFITAREMLTDGNWLLTTINGEPRYQKPPLPTWLTAFSAAIFGVENLFGLRLPAAIVGSLSVMMSYLLSYKITQSKKYAFTTGAVLATSFYVLFSGRNGQWDIYTHAFMMVAIYLLYLFFENEQKKYFKAVGIGLFLGLSFMSKGPVSMYALLLPFLLSYLIFFRKLAWKKRIFSIFLILLITTFISGFWHLYVYLNDAGTLAKITQKEATNWHSYNIRPFYYYWSFFIQSGIWTIPAFISLLYPYLKNKVLHPKAYKFTFWWTIFAVILLSLIPEKKSRYLLPVLFPLAFNISFYLNYLFQSFSHKLALKEKLGVYLHFGLIGCIGVFAPIVSLFLFSDQISGMWHWYIPLSVLMISCGVMIGVSLKKENIYASFLWSIVLIVGILLFGLPMTHSFNQNPNYHSAEEVKEFAAQNQLAVYEFGGFCPEIIWEYGEKISNIYPSENRLSPKEKEFIVLVGPEKEPEFLTTYQAYELEKIGHIDLNFSEPTSSKHRDRLYRELYKVSKN